METDIVQFKDQCIPLNQAKFLTLFDYLSIPWNWEKQIHGNELEIIRHWRDCKAMVVSLSDDKRIALAKELEEFSRHLSQPLIQWSRLTGWANWGINIFPLGRWAPQSSWDKMAGKSIRNAQVPSKSMTRADLSWLSKALSRWEGRQLPESYFWKMDSADETYFCDACPTGLGI